MVLTRGQQAGDLSSADADRFPMFSVNPVVALTDNDASGITVTASGDALNSGRKSSVSGSQSCRLASALVGTNPLGAHPAFQHHE